MRPENFPLDLADFTPVSLQNNRFGVWWPKSARSTDNWSRGLHKNGSFQAEFCIFSSWKGQIRRGNPG